MRTLKKKNESKIGDWRVIYSLNDDRKVLLVAKIDQRGRAYR